MINFMARASINGNQAHSISDHGKITSMIEHTRVPLLCHFLKKILNVGMAGCMGKELSLILKGDNGRAASTMAKDLAFIHLILSDSAQLAARIPLQ